ncbi:CLUMA_CG017351, isoform A [Clunio marinus]|uniref:CLUMA_CG017351, isoform A n=1 Tax=Clunio marinus TaxID=568069 RepID=A0A1J1J088_9DIPT|nr:CLUMA_CG017351, isoform A [Clunio marinus]
MGRRSINTTKSGKFMNPTDQARKEARKKELKKNKKQRQMVRQAVLKNKDPLQLLEEMEGIDEMEYNVLQPSPLNEKVLKEKRKKLKETFDRVMRLMQEEEPEQWSEYKRKEVEYEKRRYKRVQYYESVRHAEMVSIEDIPLPTSTNEKPLPATIPPPKINIPPPILLTNVPPPSSLKRSEDSGNDPNESKEKEPPGVPPYLPPDLFEMSELDSDYESDEKESQSEEEQENTKEDYHKDKHDKNIEDFIKEVESAALKKKEEDKANEIIRVDPTPDVEMEESVERPSVEPEKPLHPTPEFIIPKPQEMIPLPQPIAFPRIPHPLMFRPPPRGGMPMGIRMPPGPPPRPPGVGMPRMGIRMAPGPPSGPPPRHKQHHHHHDRNAPQKDPKSATITAKPQIRNLSADVTRFVPATLRVKRDEPKRTKPKSYIPETQRQNFSTQRRQQQPTKDDAYAAFMSELQDLL